MWSKLAQICVITGRAPPRSLTADEYLLGRGAVLRGGHRQTRHRPPKTLVHATVRARPRLHCSTAGRHRRPCAAAHRGPPDRSRDRLGPITAAAPVMAATMRRYLDQVAVSLRAISVTCIEHDLRQFAWLPDHRPAEVATVAGLDREPHRGLQDLAGRTARRLPEEHR